MLQKIHWLDEKNSYSDQECRSLFCNHRFSGKPCILSNFSILSGGLVSNYFCWNLVINNRSVFPGPGTPVTPVTPVDEVCEQIRLFLILYLNIFFTKSPEENLYFSQNSGSTNLIPRKVLPEMFNSERKDIREELDSLDAWFTKTLSIARDNYKAIIKALTAYERALHVISADPSLSYALLVFVLESLANTSGEYNAVWEDVNSQSISNIDTLLNDSRMSSVEDSWKDELRTTLIRDIHPKATSRFSSFTTDNIPTNFFEAKNSTSKHPIRKTRVNQSIFNAYDLRSSFSHELAPLTKYLIHQSYQAEEIELDGTSYLTLSGLFRITRSILLEYISKQNLDHL